MNMDHLKLMPPAALLLVVLCLLLPLSSAKYIDVHYCDENVEYVVKVSGVEISPFPVPRGKLTTFSIAASTEKPISGGKIKIDVSYFGFHVHKEEHDLCKGTLCPVPAGDFVLSHSLVLSKITPPGSYTFRMSMENEQKMQLTCITFAFSIGFWAPEVLSDV